jgi:hypothetical protein
MHGCPGTISRTRVALSGLAITLASSSVRADEPPPFLPPSLQKIVEQAREDNKGVAQRGEMSDDAIKGLRDIAAGDLTLGEVIDQLGSDDIAERERASDLLANVAMWDEDILAKACELPEVCAERRARLRNAIYERFINTPRPAVGITMGNNAISGILVTGLQKGFPAAGVLREGDEILVIGGVDLRPTSNNQAPLMAAIASFDPGDTIDLMVLRDGREIDLQIELGSFDDLGQQARARPDDVMQRALALRMHRLGFDLDADTGRPIAAPVSRFDWKNASRRIVRPAENVQLVSGGEASLVPGRPSGGLGTVNPSMALRAERARNDFKQPAGQPNQNQALLQQIRQIDAQIDSLSEKINDPRLNAEERARYLEAMEELTLLRKRLQLVATDPNR